MRRVACALALVMLASGAPQRARDVCKSRCESDFRLCQKRAANSEGRKICKAMRKACDRGCPPK